MKEIINYCVKENTPEFNYNKALEECVEFQEVLLKRQTKAPERQPDPMEAIKEFGDVQYRGLIALQTMFPELTRKQIKQKIKEHIKFKFSKLKEWKDSGKYKNGL